MHDLDLVLYRSPYYLVADRIIDAYQIRWPLKFVPLHIFFLKEVYITFFHFSFVGSKRLSIVKRHVQNLVASLFNIILHLQGTRMFLANTIRNRGHADPDSGSVILMSVEVLTRIFGKHALYQMDACHVSMSLRIPARLFQSILHLKITEAPTQPDSLRILDIKCTKNVESMEISSVNRQFIIELYAACCRLLCTILKHYKRYDMITYWLMIALFIFAFRHKNTILLSSA